MIFSRSAPAQCRVKNTNKKFRRSIAEQEEQAQRSRQSKEDRQKRLEEVRDRLKFD